MLECAGASLSLLMCARALVCVYTLRIVSTDKILRFTNTFIIIIIIMLKLMSLKIKDFLNKLLT